MNTKISGEVYLFGDNVDTDQIYPGRYVELTNKQDIAKCCMEGVRPGFSSIVGANPIIIAGKNFGCGSSREHAVISMKELGVKAIIAESFARIFYRNSINVGLPVLVSENVITEFSEGELIIIDLKGGFFKKVNNSKIFKCDTLPDHVLKILEAGGIINLYKEYKNRYGSFEGNDLIDV